MVDKTFSCHTSDFKFQFCPSGLVLMRLYVIRSASMMLFEISTITIFLILCQVMMKDQFANYAVQKILETSNDRQRSILLNRIRVHLNALKKYTYGKPIVARFEQLCCEGTLFCYTFDHAFIRFKFRCYLEIILEIF